MGRLPNTYADRPIQDRDPYVLYGETTLTSGQINTAFTASTFTCTTDKPLEIHRMIPRLTALDAAGVPLPVQPDQDLLASLVRVTMKIQGREQAITRVPTPIINFTKGEAERTWEFADPEYLERTEGFEVTVQADTFPVIDGLVSIRAGISFEGFMIVIAPPLPNR